MKAVFQRVDSARVTAEGKTTGEIGPGALILLGVEADDTPAHAALMAKKAAELRVFCDEHGKMNRSLLDTGGEVLAVSNFTLCANCRHGRRPEFLGAARPETARAFVRALYAGAAAPGRGQGGGRPVRRPYADIHDGERSGHDPAGYEGLAAYRTLNDHTPDEKRRSSMTIRCLPLGALQANCYLLSDEEGATAVIDPGDEAGTILETVRAGELAVEAILLTHAHFDHILAADELRRETGAPVYVYETDAPALADPRRSLTVLAKGGAGPLRADRLLKDGEELRVGRLAVSVLHTPGHTPGSCCFLCGDALFSGDTLFAGSIGRTDFPGGDDQAMAASLRMLAALEPGIRVFPGHGESTTLSKERMENPYL